MANEFDPNAAASPDSGIFCLPHTPDEAKVVLLPVPWEVTTSYRAGTAAGPAAILAASRQIDLYDVETGRPYVAGIAMLEESRDVQRWNAEGRALAEGVIAVGGRVAGNPDLERAVTRVNQLGDQLNAWVRTEVGRWLDAGKVVGLIGGDHSTPYGAFEAFEARYPGLGILHVDAHADLRAAYEGFTWSHASIMYNAHQRIHGVSRIVQVGIRDLCEAEVDVIRQSAGRIVTHFDAELATRRLGGERWGDQCKRLIADLPQQVYLSFDIDGLDPTLCPHTGTPVPGGLSFIEAQFLIGEVVRSGRTIVGFDVNEVAPGPGGDEWDANVGMRILYKIIGWALRSHGLAF